MGHVGQGAGSAKSRAIEAARVKRCLLVTKQHPTSCTRWSKQAGVIVESLAPFRTLHAEAPPDAAPGVAPQEPTLQEELDADEERWAAQVGLTFDDLSDEDCRRARKTC